MVRRALAALRAPYPWEPSPGAGLLYALGCGLFVGLFFAAFEPLGFSLLPAPPRQALFIGYGLVTFLAIAANSLLLPRLLPRLFREERWTLGRQLLWMGWVTLTIGFAAYALSGAVCARFGIPDGWVRLRTIVFETFVIAVFPITAISMANAARLLRRNLRVVGEANRRLERAAAVEPPAHAAASQPQVALVAENGRDVLRLPLADLLYVRAEENYVQVLFQGEKPGRALLRNSLTRIERQLRPFTPPLFRCHRAFIVNIARLAKVDGNAQGLKLTLKDSPALVPVARRYVGEFRRLLQGL